MADKSNRKHLIIALLLAALAFLGHSVYVSEQIAQVAPKDFVQVIRASKLIPQGSTLLPSMIERVSVPKQYAPKAALRWSDREDVLRRKCSVDVLRGDYVMRAYFSDRPSVGRVLSSQLKGEKERAVSLPVDESNSLARSIVAGDRIDIVFNFTLPGLRAKMSSLLLQNIPVISTGSYSAAEQERGSYAGSRQRYNVLTLAMSAEDALRLNYARQNGQIGVLLRNQADTGRIDTLPISSVLDILPAEDRGRLEQLAKQQQGEVEAQQEAFKRQLEEYFKQQNQR